MCPMTVSLRVAIKRNTQRCSTHYARVHKGDIGHGTHGTHGTPTHLNIFYLGIKNGNLI